jgi:hypothetical protein
MLTRRVDRSELRPGLRVFFWWDTGAMGPTQIICEVVRVNRVTVDVRNRYGEIQRARIESIAGIWEDDGESR